MLRFTGTTAGGLGARFLREGTTTSKRALRHMRQVAKLVMEQSIANSPVDWKGPHGRSSPPGHELERAHHIVENIGSGDRLESTVAVDGTIDGVNVDDYAMYLHESFEWKLGPASEAKMMQSPKNKVGPLYLERALAEYDDEFEDLLDEIMEGLML